MRQKSDLISRQEAIDEISKYGSVWMEYTDIMTVHEVAERALKESKQSMINVLRKLPSAKPEIIHCRECRFGEVDDPCFPDQYFCRHHGCDWNNGDHYCGYAERREEI